VVTLFCSARHGGLRLGKVNVFPNSEALNHAVASAIVKCAQHSVALRGRFSIALSGGETPRSIYQLLHQVPFHHQMPWQQTHIFFTDERTVPPDHKDSNFGMANSALLSRVPLLQENIHRIEAEDPQPKAAAHRYAETLEKFVPRRHQLPQFDLVLLGVGTDGHVASLFPGTTILQETAQLVAAVMVEKLKTWRISLTFPVINHADNIFIIAAGSEKASVLEEVFAGNSQAKFPVQQLQPEGNLSWFLDKDAALKLPSSK